MKQNHLQQQGFSLLEVLITLFMIGVMLVLYESALNTIVLSRNAKDQQIALRVANHKLEELRAAGYDAMPGSGSFSDSQMSLLPQANGTVDVIDYTNRTKWATVTVTWREPGAAADHTIVLETLVTRVGGLK